VASIPRVPSNGVSPAAYPNVRVSPDAPVQAFGGGNGTFQEAGALAGDVGQRAYQDAQKRNAHNQKLKDEANQIASGEFLAKFTAEEIRLKSQLSSVKGKDAVKASDDTMASFDKFYEDQTRSIIDPDLRQRVRGHFLTSRNSVAAFAIPYGASQHMAYDNETSDAIVQNETKAAVDSWNDPERIQLAVARVFGSIEALGARNGKPEEWMKAEERQSLGRLYTGVIGRMLAAGDHARAQDFFTKHQNDFTDPAAVERSMKQTNILGDAQAAADKVIKGEVLPSGEAVMPETNRQDALDRIDEMAKGKEPLFREHARDLVNKRWDELEQGEKKRQEALYESITRQYDADPNQDPRQIDPLGWQMLPTHLRDAISNRYKKDQRNDGLFLSFMAKDQKQVAAYSPAQFEAEVWSKLPDKQRDEARTRWTAAIDAVGKPEKSVIFKGMISDEEKVWNSLAGAPGSGIPAGTTLEDAEKVWKETSVGKKDRQSQLDYMKFRDDVQSAWGIATALKKEPLGDDEKQKIIDRLLIPKVFSGGKEKPVVLLTETERREARIPIDKIPKADRKFYENQIKAKGKKVTDDKIERAYAALVEMGDKFRADEIMSE
jgi:hypothetical protein